MEPDAFSGAVAGPGRRVSAEGRTATEDREADGLYGRCVVSEEKHFSAFLFFWEVAGSRTGPREKEHEKAHGSSADTRRASLRGCGLQV